MSTPEQARRGERALAARDRPAAEPGPTLGERLLAAREQKGVDLYRAERDTKIRAKYLAALEHGDFSELPGSVYTKGFLRNYALYLGLDPDAVLEQYRGEYGASRASEPVVIVPPALEAPRGGLTFTPGLVVAAVLILAVVAFAGYITLQLVRFAKPPTLAVTQPAALVSEISQGDQTVLSGTSDAGATITIRGPGMQVYRTSADTSGNWQKEVPLSKGRNDFTVIATDPATAKDSVPISLIITVPIPVIEAPTLAVTSPNDGTTVTNGAIPVQGTTNASSVTVAARYLGPASSGGTARPSQTPAATPSHGPGASPAATPVPSPSAAPKQIAVGQDGTFSDSYQLSPGQWQLTISASSDQGKTTTESRAVTVAFIGVDLVVQVQGGRAWLKVWVDGVLDPNVGPNGQVYGDGTTLEFSGKQSVEVRTGNAGATFFTRNGVPLGALGPSGMPQTWLFLPPPIPPKQTDHT